MTNNKIWKVKNRTDVYTDKELIDLIVSGVLTGEDEIMCHEMLDFMSIKETIYQFYLYLKENNKDENI